MHPRLIIIHVPLCFDSHRQPIVSRPWSLVIPIPSSFQSPLQTDPQLLNYLCGQPKDISLVASLFGQKLWNSGVGCKCYNPTMLEGYNTQSKGTGDGQGQGCRQDFTLTVNQTIISWVTWSNYILAADVTRPGFDCLFLSFRPTLWIMWKYLKAILSDLPIGSWYLNNTKKFCLIIWISCK